jgi:hypothetical protein
MRQAFDKPSATTGAERVSGYCWSVDGLGFGTGAKPRCVSHAPRHHGFILAVHRRLLPLDTFLVGSSVFLNRHGLRVDCRLSIAACRLADTLRSVHRLDTCPPPRSGPSGLAVWDVSCLYGNLTSPGIELTADAMTCQTGGSRRIRSCRWRRPRPCCISSATPASACPHSASVVRTCPCRVWHGCIMFHGQCEHVSGPGRATTTDARRRRLFISIIKREQVPEQKVSYVERAHSFSPPLGLFHLFSSAGRTLLSLNFQFSPTYLST